MDTSFLYRTMTGQIGKGNSIGRNSGASNDNFFTKRAKSIENAFGTTGSALVGGINNLIEKGNAADREQKQKDNLDEIAKKYGFKDRYAVFDAAYEAKEKGDKETADRLDKTVMAEFRGQAAADSKEAADAARNWQKYSNDSYISKKINQDQGKFAGSAINTLSTAVDLTGLSANPLANSIQGGIEGIADELEQNGFKDFSLERAGQNALIGAATGAATGALNKGLSNSLAKRGGNLFKGGNKLTQGLNTLGSKTALGRVGSTIATGAGRGAISGAVGGATGAGLSAAMNGGDIIGSAFEGAKQGIGQGAMTGGIMAGANLALSKTPGVGDFYNELQSARSRWDQSGSNFDERLTNTLTSGDSAVGDWLMGKTNSKALGSIGSIGDTIRDYTDQGYGPRQAERKAYEDLIKEYYDEDRGGLRGAIEDAQAAGLPSDSNFRKAQRLVEGGSLGVSAEDAFNDLKDVYGDDFKESTYLNKDGSWKYKNGEPYVWTVYKNKLAMNLAKQLDAYDANDANGYVPGSEKEDYIPGIGDAYETAVKARNARLNYLRNELENGRISYGELAELQNYKPQILASGDAQLAEAAGIPEDEFNAYNSRQSATPAQDAYSQGKGSFSDALNEFIDQGGHIVRDQDGNMRLVKPGVDTPTTAKGWLKKAGERIVEDVNKTNLGNRISPVGSPKHNKAMDLAKRALVEFEQADPYEYEESMTNMAEAEGLDWNTAKGKKAFTEKWLKDTTRDLLAGGDDREMWAGSLEDYVDAPRLDNGVNPANGGTVRNAELQQLINDIRSFDQTETPTTAKGWLKKAGQRIVEDVNKSNLGNRIKAVNDEYSNDIRNMKINDWNEEPIEGEVIEAPRSQTTRQLPARQVDAWDRLAQENGYNSYDEVIQRYMEANPNTPLNPRGAAGQILSWLDENPNTPTTARGWARQAVNRAAEDLNNSNLGMRIKDVSQDNPQTQIYRALNGDEDLPELFRPEARNQIETKNKFQLVGTQFENVGENIKRQSLYGSLDAKTASRATQTKAPQTLSSLGIEPENYLEAAKTSNYINQVVSDLAENSNVKVNVPDMAERLAAASDDVTFMSTDAPNKFAKAIRQIVADGSTPDEYSAKYLIEKSREFGNKAAKIKDSSADSKALRTALTNAKYILRDEAANALAKANVTGADTNNKIAQGLAKMGANEKVIDWYTKDENGKAPTARDYIRRSSLFEQARDMGTQMQAEKLTRSASKEPTRVSTKILRASGLEEPLEIILNNTVAPLAGAATKLAGKAIKGVGDIGARIGGGSAPTSETAVATPLPITNANNPAMNIYNAIGRTEGLSNIDQARTANYLNDAAEDMNAEAGYMPPLGVSTSTYGAPTTSTSVYDTMAGTASEPTATATAPAGNNYFQPTGDYWTDTIARALTSAINADDVTAFASLYKMYQDALSKIQTASSNASSANSNQKITATQQRANAAMNSLGRISKMTPDLGYNLSNIPIIGDIATFGGNDYEAEAKSLAQQIGYMVSGANIKEEEAYNIGKAYVPQPWDSEQTRQNKLQRAYEIIQQYQNNYAV